MPTKDKSAQTPTTQTIKHVVLSSGGSRAILGGAGAIAAIEQAGIKDLVTVGGISGGSIPAVLYAGGYSAVETLRLALDIDFSSKLTRHGSIIQILFAYFMQGRFEKTRPRKGVLSSEKLGDYILEMVPKRGANADPDLKWPKGYWTMAIVGDKKIFFTEKGVFELDPDGKMTVLQDTPGPLDIAVRATCAVPGIISAVPWKGRFLFDGALSPEGRCPVNMPKRYFGAKDDEIVAFDVGDDGNKTSSFVLKAWSILCGNECVPDFQEVELTNEHGMVVIEPVMTQFRSLKFTLSRDEKWQAVMAGYIESVKQLANHGLLRGDKLAEAQKVVETYETIDSVCKYAEEGVLSRLTEELLSKYGLF
jgi:predicted acylesterase/phospholipase RssA